MSDDHMIIDTIRNGKAVSIEIRNNPKGPAPIITAASVDGEQVIKSGKITKAMRKAVASLKGKRDHTHIDLGLAILCSKEGYERYGTGHTSDFISSFGGCSKQRIEQIEKKGMRKIRAALYRDKTLEKDLKEMFGK